MIRQLLAVLTIVAFAAMVVWAFWETVENDADTVARRDALLSMERAGGMSVNNTTLYLWKFEFEGKQCLWATASVGRGGRGGLTCWEKKP